ELKTGFTDLSSSWMKFYTNFGIHHATAIMELSMHAEPLGQEIQLETVPALLAAERRNVEAASTNFDQVSELTDRISFALFLLSTLTAAIIAYRISKYLTTRLEALKEGAAMIGSGHLDRKIKLGARDELGALASAFNDM